MFYDKVKVARTAHVRHFPPGRQWLNMMLQLYHTVLE